MSAHLINPYDPKWPERFAEMRTILTDALLMLPVVVHHVGSTSVPDLAAKNIIDINIEFPPEVNFNTIRSGLENIGYRHVGDQGIPKREVFKLTEESTSVPDLLRMHRHHLYVCPSGSDELARHLYFRDALRKDAALRDEYAAIKFELAIAALNDPKRYAHLKQTTTNKFFAKVLG